MAIERPLTDRRADIHEDFSLPCLRAGLVLERARLAPGPHRERIAQGIQPTTRQEGIKLGLERRRLRGRGHQDSRAGRTRAQGVPAG